eukprot:Clim_evm16s204 gene=Clim_evmTU16s204
MGKPSIVVFVSGSGTNLQTIIDQVESGVLPVEITCVVSNRKAAFALERAKNAGIETMYLPLLPFKKEGKTREEYDAHVAEKVLELKPDLCVLAGWMHVFSSAFLDKFENKVINLHPALPNEYDGVNAIERAFNDWKDGKTKRSGVMVHYVIPAVDKGEAILTEEVPFKDDDTPEEFEERMHKVEHKLLPKAIHKLLCEK